MIKLCASVDDANYEFYEFSTNLTFYVFFWIDAEFRDRSSRPIFESNLSGQILQTSND